MSETLLSPNLAKMTRKMLQKPFNRLCRNKKDSCLNKLYQMILIIKVFGWDAIKKLSWHT